MTEKDNVSMATVQMKPDYAASEVYSTASEAPPAYKRQSNSVKIAKIAAFTIVASSFILGAFILASSYLQAKASCDQVQALDSVLEKELMLETLQQVNKELPRAEALLGKETADEVDLQNLQKEPITKKFESKKFAANGDEDATAATNNKDDEDDSTYYDSEENDDKWHKKVPVELDLSDLATVILQNNKKSRMNCVFERKHAEEFVNSPSKTVALPFGMNLTTDPKKARITGERISISCDGGDENNKEQQEQINNNNINMHKQQQQRDEDSDEVDEVFDPVRAVYLPMQRIPIPFGQIPQQFPLTHMPQRMLPPPPPPQQMQPQQPFMRQMPSPFHFQMRPPMPPQVMQAPHPEPQMMHNNMLDAPPQQQTVRIHVQQIPFREIHVADDVPVQIPAQQQELPHFEIQRMPLVVALRRAGITAEDLSNIKRMAEDRITDELRRLAAEEAAESAENNNNSDEDNSNDSSQSSDQNSSEQQSQQQESQSSQREEQQQLTDDQPQQQAHEQAPEQTQPPQPVVQRLILRPLPDQPRDTMTPPMPDNMMQYNRAAYGRSLAQPVRIPVPMMPMVPPQANAEDNGAAAPMSERPHFVQPRSV